MRQLGIVDAAFVNIENPTIPQHIGSLAVFDPSTAPGGFVRFKDVLRNFERRLKRLPIFRTRLVEVPLGLDRPYWVLDPNFDVEFHIRHIALPKPGDWRQLCIQTARLHSRPLDMSRPLWECYIIEGLDNIPNLPEGCWAIYTKMHHSLVDGAGGQAFMSALFDLEPVPSQDLEPTEAAPLFGDLQPSDVRLLGMTLAKLPGRIAGAIKGTATLASEIGSMARRILNDELPAAALAGPKVRFDEPVGPNRVFEGRLFTLEEFKTLKNAVGVTINDISVALVSGALRKYLMAHNELPEESLLVSMPVNMRTRIGENQDNNQIGSMQASLCTNIADPLERLQAIKKSLDDGKKWIDTPMVSVMKVPGVLPPLIAKPIWRTYVRNKLTRYMPMGQATVITNVPGPPFPVYCAGAKLVCMYPLGLINPGLGLFHAVFSHGGNVAVSITADRDQMPDPEFYRECIDAAWEELSEALLGKPGVSAAAASKPAAKRRTAAGKRAAGARTRGKRLTKTAAPGRKAGRRA
ncbi:MAG: WS/DGAT/MGAT family O-acyltransferase [Gammaproteobacteria bacterium]